MTYRFDWAKLAAEKLDQMEELRGRFIEHWEGERFEEYCVTREKYDEVFTEVSLCLDLDNITANEYVTLSMRLSHILRATSLWYKDVTKDG